MALKKFFKFGNKREKENDEIEGIVLEKSDANSNNVIYVTSDNTKFDNDISNKEIRGIESKNSGDIKTFVFGDMADIVPAETTTTLNTYKTDYHFTNTDTDKKGVLIGGYASNSNSAGFCCLNSHYGVNTSDPYRGFFSCVRYNSV